LKNDTSKELRISFAATGTWCLYNVPTKDPALAVFNAQTDWKGYQLPKATYTKYKWRQADAPAGALLVEIFDAQGARKSVLASPASVDLVPGGSATFLVNDDPAWYVNNSGQISLEYACRPKDEQVARTGKLLVLYDEWILSDEAFRQAPDTKAFANNIAKIFNSNNQGGRFLDYSSVFTSHPLLKSTELEKALTTAPYNTFDRVSSPTLDLMSLSSYDGIFIGREPRDNKLLTEYINSGGSVCLMLGAFNTEAEARMWNPLLEGYGLSCAAFNDKTVRVLAVNNQEHPFFTGVKSLFDGNGMTIKLLPNSKATIIWESDSQGLVGYVEVPVPAPQ
jgi:hypothetical protein